MTGTVIGSMLGIPGHGRRMTFRILHVFEFRDGLISRENVWLDGGAVVAQLTAGVKPRRARARPGLTPRPGGGVPPAVPDWPPAGRVREPETAMSPVKERTPRNPRSLALALGGIIIGLVVLVVVFVVALPSLTEEGKVEVKLGADTFTVGQARPKAESIATDGPFLFSDVANGQRDIYVQHLGDDPLTGWSAFDARAAGRGRDCSCAGSSEPSEFVDPCSGQTVPADGAGPADATRSRSTSDETVMVDFNAAARRTPPRPRGTRSRPPPARSWSPAPSTAADPPGGPRRHRTDSRRHRAETSPGSDLLERRPGQEQRLLADVAEAHHGLGLVARAPHREDDAVAEGAVADVVAHLEAELIGAARRRGRDAQRGLDHPVAVGVAGAAARGRTRAVVVGIERRDRRPAARRARDRRRRWSSRAGGRRGRCAPP